MATVKGVNRTILDAKTVDHTLEAGLAEGSVKVMVDTYEASALAQASIIEMGGELPIGAKVIMVMLIHDACGASVTIDVGDLEDVDRYLDGVDVSGAGSTVSNLADGVEYKIDMTTAATPDNQVVLTIGGSGTATGTIKLVVYYVNE